MIPPTYPPTNNIILNLATPKTSKCKQGLLKRSSHQSRDFKDIK